MKHVAFPFFPLLTLIFVTMKLTGHIDWSWWLVLSPMPVAFVVTFIAISIYLMCSVGTRFK